MGNSLPRPLRDDQDKRLFVEYDPATNKYFEVNPLTDKRREVCGELLDDGSRCRKDVGLCDHSKDKQQQLAYVPDPGSLLEVLGRLVVENSGDEQLQVCIDLAQQLSQSQLMSLTADIQLGYAIMFKFIASREKKEGGITAKDLTSVLQILREITRAKEIQAKLESRVRFDDREYTEFMKEFFAVLQKELSKDDYHKILVALEDRVLAPRRAASIISNRIPSVQEAVIVRDK